MKKNSLSHAAAPFLAALVLVTGVLTTGVLITACRTSASALSAYDFKFTDIPAYRVEAPLPFSRGINLNGWLDDLSPRLINPDRYTEQDFVKLKNIGVDVIRLPLKLHNMTLGNPGSEPRNATAGFDYTLDPVFLAYVDQAVDWAEKHQIYLILDNHSFYSPDPTIPDVDKILIPVWRQMAARYRDRSDYVLYEILNEPNGIELGLWSEIQGRIIAEIRSIDSRHFIIAGGADYNDINALFSLPEYPFDRLIYTFHFYDPSLFTHQGWGDLLNLGAMPFPADAHAIPALPESFKGSWAETLSGTYRQDATVRALARQLDKAAMFSRERGDVPLFCGEYGASINNIIKEDRLRWYETVSTMLNNRNIAGTVWSYAGGFGIFNTENSRSFENELNTELLKVIGFEPPAQERK